MKLPADWFGTDVTQELSHAAPDIVTNGLSTANGEQEENEDGLASTEEGINISNEVAWAHTLGPIVDIISSFLQFDSQSSSQATEDTGHGKFAITQ